MLDRIDEITTPPSHRLDRETFDPARWIVSINSQLDDWYQVYQYAENAAEVFRTLDERGVARVGQLLQSLTGQRGRQLTRQFGCRLPREFWTWQAGGTRLIVLSARAPRRPVHHPRRVAWR
jgi:hypothetical protein